MNSERPRLSLIVAMSRNGVIGKDNRLPWHLPADLQRFKALTLGHTIIMGRRTWESIGRALPGRRSVVVTTNANLHAEGAVTVDSLDAAIAAAMGEDEVFVIGGAQLFRLALARADRIYLTIVQGEFEGDTFMPAIDPSRWRRVHCESHAASGAGALAWRFEVHERAA